MTTLTSHHSLAWRASTRIDPGTLSIQIYASGNRLKPWGAREREEERGSRFVLGAGPEAEVHTGSVPKWQTC